MSEAMQVKKALAPASSFKLVRTLGIVATLSGVLVVSVYDFTQPFIAANKDAMMAKAVFEVVPGVVIRKNFVLTPDGLVPDNGKADGAKVLAGYDAEGKLKGIAAEAAAPGYADVIRLLYGYDPECQCITGINVLQSTETPGLGDKIYKDAAFLANFEALDARLNAKGDALAHPIVTVKHGTKASPWQIDAISGATVSSKAVGKALNDSAQTLLPRLANEWEKLR